MPKYEIDFDGIIRFAVNKDEVIAALLAELYAMSEKPHKVTFPDGSYIVADGWS